MTKQQKAEIESLHEEGLSYRDNAGAYDCCIDLLTRAQISLEAKIRIREMLDKAIARLMNGLPVRMNRFAGDQYRTIGLVLYELIMQAESYYISAK